MAGSRNCREGNFYWTCTGSSPTKSKYLPILSSNLRTPDTPIWEGNPPREGAGMTRVETIHRAIRHVYEAALAPDDWTSAIVSVTEAIEVPKAMLHVQAT